MGSLEHIIFQILDARLTARQTSRAMRELLTVAQSVEDTSELTELNYKLMRRWQRVFYPEERAR